MKRILMITGHYLESARRAGFHLLADAFWRRGHEVVFATVAISWLSLIRLNYRLRYPVLGQANRLRWVRPRLGSYVWWTPWHPADLRSRLLNRLTSGWFSRYAQLPLGELGALAAQADLMIFESTPGLMLLDALKPLHPGARCVYRVSDDMRHLQVHPVVRQAEDRLVDQFDLVSVPTQSIFDRFAHLRRTRLAPHGVNKEMFDQPWPNPYNSRAQANAVFVGVSLLDRGFLDQAAGLFPQWDFHVVGPMRRLPRRDNIIAHGAVDFIKTAPFIQHADIGLHCLEDRPGIEAFADSLKVMQYTYCRLPIVAPQSMQCPRSNFRYYQPGDAPSIRQALLEARAMDRGAIDAGGIRSWDELAVELEG